MAISYRQFSSNLPDCMEGVYDSVGEYCWFAPEDPDLLCRVSGGAAGILSSYPVTQGPTWAIRRFGDYIYMAPKTTHQGIIQVNPAKGYDVVEAVGSWSETNPPESKGLVSDGTYLWSNSGYTANGLIRWNPANIDAYVTYTHEKGLGPVIFDGEYLWVCPASRGYFSKFNTSGVFQAEYAISNFVANYSLNAEYDGSKYIVTAPYNGDYITKFDVTTNTPTNYAIDTPPSEMTMDICFDGTDFWIAPYYYTKLIQFNADTGTITYHADMPGASTTRGNRGIAYNASNGKIVVGPGGGAFKRIVEFTSPNYLGVPTAPTITTHPGPTQRVNDGDSVVFTIVATGTATLLYQWEKDTVPIGGATSTSYTIDPVDESHAAEYRCVVTNDEGDATSNVATLTVNEAGGSFDWPTLGNVSGWPMLG